MATPVAPQPLDADNTSGSSAAAANDWHPGWQIPCRHEPPAQAQPRCRIYDCKRFSAAITIDSVSTSVGSPYTKCLRDASSVAAWQSEPGATLLVPSGPRGLHLFIIVLGPVVLPTYGPTPQTAMVSATSIHSGVPHDAACELDSGDHPFVHHASYIASATCGSIPSHMSSRWYRAVPGHRMIRARHGCWTA